MARFYPSDIGRYSPGLGPLRGLSLSASAHTSLCVPPLMGFHMTPDGEPPIVMFALQSFKEPPGLILLFRAVSPSVRFLSSVARAEALASSEPLRRPRSLFPEIGRAHV